VIPISRYDKYDPISGGFRAPLAANFAYTSSKPDYAHADLNKVKAVSLDATGKVVMGTAGNSGFVGVLVLGEPAAAGDVVDVMQSGEIVEFLTNAGAAAAAGTVYTSNADGTYGTTAVGASNFKIGYTVEATRLVVRV
jgi:hypothetical protein